MKAHPLVSIVIIALALHGCPAPAPQLPVACRLWVGASTATEGALADGVSGRSHVGARVPPESPRFDMVRLCRPRALCPVSSFSPRQENAPVRHSGLVLQRLIDTVVPTGDQERKLRFPRARARACARVLGKNPPPKHPKATRWHGQNADCISWGWLPGERRSQEPVKPGAMRVGLSCS